MAAYEPTTSYRLIYIFAIHDKDHEGYLKIGDTTFDSTKSYKQLPPNCEELNQAARDRIDDYTKTAMKCYTAPAIHPRISGFQTVRANGLRCRCPLPSVQFRRSRKAARR